MQFFSEKCIVCAECTRVCPVEAQQLVDGLRLYQRDLCQSCGACVAECYARALVIPVQALSPAQVLAEALKDRDDHRDFGRWVTFSGGEPFLQKDFLLELLALCRQWAAHRGGYRGQCTLRLAGAGAAPHRPVPVRLQDLRRAAPPQRHRREQPAHSGKFAAVGAGWARLWVRIPVIPGLNDATAEIRQIGDFLSGCAGGGAGRTAALPSPGRWKI